MPIEESRMSIQMFFFGERFSPFRIIVLQDNSNFSSNFQHHDAFNNRCNDYLPQKAEYASMVDVVPDMPHLYALPNAIAGILQAVWAREWDMLLDNIDDCVRIQVRTICPVCLYNISFSRINPWCSMRGDDDSGPRCCRIVNVRRFIHTLTDLLQFPPAVAIAA